MLTKGDGCGSARKTAAEKLRAMRKGSVKKWHSFSLRARRPEPEFDTIVLAEEVQESTEELPTPLSSARRRHSADNPVLDETFIGPLQKAQAARLDDQRVDPAILQYNSSQSRKALLEVLSRATERRMNEPRHQPAAHNNGAAHGGHANNVHARSSTSNAGYVDEHLYEDIIRAQSQRIDEQRSELGGSSHTLSRAQTFPEEEIGKLVDKMTAGRYEDQRASLNRKQSTN